MTFEGIVNPTTMEALACRESPDLATDLQLQRVMVFSDFLQFVNGICEGSMSSYLFLWRLPNVAKTSLTRISSMSRKE
jgi:hypothetical protein